MVSFRIRSSRMAPVGLLALALLPLTLASEKAPQKIVDLANGTLARLGSDPVIVGAVKTENAKRKTLAQIQEIDRKWTVTPGIDPFMKSILDNACSRQLRKIRSSAPYYSEVFVTDNQGANVGMSDKTSDYWQGDEDKFTKCFDGAAGRLYVADVAFDKSTQTYSVQVSIPVRDGGKAIGVLVVAIDVDRFVK